jgi:hypothetical protein
VTGSGSGGAGTGGWWDLRVIAGAARWAAAPGVGGGTFQRLNVERSNVRAMSGPLANTSTIGPTPNPDPGLRRSWRIRLVSTPPAVLTVL